ncbi:MAG TPA: pantoate--beta-alanine ligase [Methylophaga sp.]|jgi:pantoate--beta-alanine ligase|uniref:pantoate--beta-alanine ligase n=1 Tax=unclassified Methylophaga TaxID=2629249 RepID=UPI000C8B5F3A|nr:MULTISPECIES: pantoate--beta-alanine ligase [unclassified Methylophaga]MAP25392.1 pantoate--beta-alanine ligase [Methylophaga sp.]HAD31759.1 pantoate--beta-alanine ligase [Methylophaga sp.]HBX61127.1 pantoate--beta-alanine ligase [Methylophaga sp.]HCN99116.1 pantoate--beta-alanine ligase [Methylophaga sp.]|tara:strand:- start:2594 stop:3448 length:855 start_codon:yes stop_codon:yes gene_type:complete
MQIVESILSLRGQIKTWRAEHRTIAFVPTMGNLHDGHISLVKKAQTLADKVVVSIFVNPLQFDDKRDLANYPRTLQTDIKKLTQVGCNLLFTPDTEVMYPQGKDFHTFIHVPGMDDKLCGLERPGHFDGVATVVTKFFNIVQADVAVFGEKDYQQLLLIRKLVADLNLPIKIVGAATVREDSGLAMSSRNQHLNETLKQQAAALYSNLLELKQQLESGNQDYSALLAQAHMQLTASGFTLDYIDIRRAEDLQLANPAVDKELRLLAAGRVGSVRLIDNIACNLA